MWQNIGGAMKFQINVDKISLSPNNKEEIIINKDSEYLLTQLKSQLKNSGNSSVLISGYRGSGKTTLIRKLINSYDDNKCVFVEVDFTKYEKLSIVLRKLIRELYLSIEKANKFDEIQDESLVEQIKLLYDHTFFEISTLSNITKLREHTLEISTKFKLKDFLKSILPFAAVFLSGVNLGFGFVPFIISNFDWVLFFVSIVWFFISCTIITKGFKNNKSKIEEDTRKSLYDDEIAEYHLKTVLKNLNEKKFNVVFVFDELDKIEKSDDMINLISDLKPLLLSDLASFIMISGQKMYYKLQSSNLLDDSLISSIFSKNIHVPLADECDLDKIFYEILVDKDILDNKLVRTYKKSVVLNSNGTLRRFINRLLQDVVWIDEKAFIDIEDSSAGKYETDSKILSILNNTIENQIDNNEYDVGIRDFLIYQLYIWIKRMKLKGNVYFTLSDIFDFNNDYSDDYHLWYEVELTDLCNDLIMQLVYDELLETKESDGEKFFRWVPSADIYVSSLINIDSNSKYNYLREIIEIEELSREILTDLSIENGLRIKSLRNIIEALVKNHIVSSKWLQDEYMIYINLSNKIRHGEKISNSDMEKINLSKSNAIRMKSELFEGYSSIVIKKCLNPLNYEVIHNQRIHNNETVKEFDIIAKNEDKSDIVFEVKYRRSLRNNDIKQILNNVAESLKTYNKSSNKNNKLILLIYSSEVDDRMLSKVNDILKDIIIDERYKNIRVLIVSKRDKVFDSERIVRFIENFEVQE